MPPGRVRPRSPAGGARPPGAAERRPGALHRPPLRQPRRAARGHRAGGLRRPDPGHRALRPQPGEGVQHLRHPHHHGRDPPPLPRPLLGGPRAPAAAGGLHPGDARARAALPPAGTRALGDGGRRARRARPRRGARRLRGLAGAPGGLARLHPAPRLRRRRGRAARAAWPGGREPRAGRDPGAGGAVDGPPVAARARHHGAALLRPAPPAGGRAAAGHLPDARLPAAALGPGAHAP
ncbi:MAG: hypothetical protein QOG45_2920 [Chloroflexota bacterium]|nr:hypothetical protein [Chloroflexota bacterium]